MITVYKYPLQVADEQDVVMPLDARILKADAQGDNLCLWALVDTEQLQTEKRHIVVAGTGRSLNRLYDPNIGRHYAFLGTAMMRGGEFVWHIFELGRQQQNI